MANSRKSRRNQAASRTSTAQLNKSYFHHEQDAAYADALVSLLSRANTILTGREINCGLSEAVQIAATDGNTIYFNISEVSAMIRKLRITRSVPTKQQYDEAVSNIASGYWDMSRQAWQYRHHHLRNASAYLWRKYLEFPEIFKLPYEEFCSALVRKEMGTSIRAFATLRGLNYHELSHCLYTPTTGGSLRKTILDINEEFRQIRNHINFDAKQAFSTAAVVCDAAGLDANDHKEICTVIADGQSHYQPESRHKWVAENMEKWRRFEKVCDWLSSAHYWHKMWNVLEDQRIESLFVARFPSARHFFTATVLKYIATYRPDGQDNRDEQKKGAGYLLLTGRKYISKKVRNTYRELLKSDYQLTDQQVAEFELLVEQFRKLSIFKSQAEVENAVGIVRALGLWCIKHISNPTSIPEPEGGFEHDSQAKTGKETGKRDSAEAQERREEQEERWEQEEEDSDGDDSDSDSDSDSGSEDESDEDADSDSSADGEDSDSEEDGGDSDKPSDKSGDKSGDNSQNRRHQDSDSDSDSGSGTGASASDSTDSRRKTAEEVLAEALSDAQQSLDDDAVRQIEALHETVRKERVGRFFRELYTPDKTVEPPTLYRSLSNAISNALTKLNSDRDNQWEKGSSTGVVNVLRYAESRGAHTDFFDEWQEDGDERPDAEICVLLDLSSSMNSMSIESQKRYYQSGKPKYEFVGSTTNAEEASCAMWAIKYACQRNDILCSVIGYSDGAFPLYSSDDAVTSGQTPVFYGLSGTHPTDALAIAQGVLEKSEAKHKILVSLSDGEWQVDGKTIQLVDNLNKLGVQTVFIQLAHHYDYAAQKATFNDQHGYTYGGKKKGFYHHQEHLKVETCSELTKKIGAILLKAVRE